MIEKSAIEKKDRLLGVAVPVGALRSAESTGVGEFLDLIDFAGLCAGMGISLIQILPVNDTGYESSPYSALTAFALHPLYIRLKALDEAASFNTAIEELGGQFNRESRFPYDKVLRAKMNLLRQMYNANAAVIEAEARSGVLSRWIEENPWVKTYAVFRRLKESNGEKSWKEWTLYRQVSPGDVRFLWEDPVLKGEHLFWVWLQKALDRQFARAAKAIRNMGLFLEGDIPILMNEDSCDVWSGPDIFRLDLSAGAPPDMYSPGGQNWGFPIYNWECQSQDNFSWWKARLKSASRYYDAYRIDHVLGFFRIWASSRFDDSAALGRYVPYVPVTREDLEKLGFNGERIRWLSQPHIPAGDVWDAVRSNWGGVTSSGEIAAEAGRIFDQALDRIGNEDLWLFKKKIRGEKDLRSLGLRPPAEAALIHFWHDRLFYEYQEGEFFPVWYYRNSRSYNSLSEAERSGLEELLALRKTESEQIWESGGLRFLSVLAESSPMLPCAEDLGAVPDCVPRVLAKLHILGLRVIRWTRRWDHEGQPYVPFSEYPELSVCTPSVHDSSTLREWWDTEADQKTFAGFLGIPSLPRVYNPGTAKIVLKHAAAAASRFRVFQIQDLLHLSQHWYAAEPSQERINIPGTTGAFNWTYRLPATIQELSMDTDLIQAIKELAEAGPEK
ncbi:MAG: 4-alpha-glucanotransferase [Spirochaetaceae bacterium]|jgi:4-alpha-glucanotransferase|nr:4-alpha-glucanotransferase [Spirochaetaceae bacterium]